MSQGSIYTCSLQRKSSKSSVRWTNRRAQTLLKGGTVENLYINIGKQSKFQYTSLTLKVLKTE